MNVGEREIALWVFDLLHLFGRNPIDYHEFSRHFGASASRSEDATRRLWGRIRSSLKRNDVPHELLEHGGGSALKFSHESRAFVERVLEPSRA